MNLTDIGISKLMICAKITMRTIYRSTFYYASPRTRNAAERGEKRDKERRRLDPGLWLVPRIDSLLPSARKVSHLFSCISASPFSLYTNLSFSPPMRVYGFLITCYTA